MKRIIKNNLLGFILGTIIFGSIGVIATTVITADQVDYDSNHTVKEKIDDLYDDVNRDLTFSNDASNRSVGSVQATGERTASITLNKGKYIVSVVSSLGYTTSTNTDTRTTSGQADLRDISCTNNCGITQLIRHYSVGTAGTKDSQNVYRASTIIHANYYIDVKTDGTVVTGSMGSWDHSANNINVENILINAVKVTK